MYDFGKSNDFSPIEFLRKNIIPYLDTYKGERIAQAIISHPHVDHISEISCLLNSDDNKSMFYPSLLTCPHDKEDAEKPEMIDWRRIKSPKGSEEILKIFMPPQKNLWVKFGKGKSPSV